MKKISSILVLFLLIFKTSLASNYSSDPQVFVEELVNEAISKLADKNLNKEEKALFIESVALENVDINALGLYTLGELRKSADKDNLKRYQEIFEKYFLMKGFSYNNLFCKFFQAPLFLIWHYL